MNEVQFQNIKANDIEQFRDPQTEVILWPPELKTGALMYPYSEVKSLRIRSAHGMAGGHCQPRRATNAAA